MPLMSKRCFHCGYEAPVAAPFCAQCGTRFVPCPPGHDSYVCENCETSLPSGSLFCPGCGQAFDEPVPETSPQTMSSESVPIAPSEPDPITPTVKLKTPSFSHASGPKVNYGWLSEAWQLFQQKPNVWVLSTLAQYLPFVLLYGVAFLFGIAGSAGNVSATPYTDPRAYEGGQNGLQLGIIAAFIPAFLLSCQLNYATSMMANKQVRGEIITISDIFRRGRGVWPIFWLSQIWALLVFIGALLFYVPALLLIGLTLPCSSLAAEGVGPVESLRRSVDAMKNDWLNAVGVAVLFLLVVLASAIPCGLGLLVTYPMANLLASLACRDMIGMPQPFDLGIVPAPSNNDLPRVSVPQPPARIRAMLLQKPIGEVSSVLGGMVATRGMVVTIGGLVIVLCLTVGFWLFHLAHPSTPTVTADISGTPATTEKTSDSGVLIRDKAPEVSTSTPGTVFPVHWGGYTITREDIGRSEVDRQQRVSIRNVGGEVLWKAEDAAISSAEECRVTGMHDADLEILTDSGAHYRNGTAYFFSRTNGLHLLFTNSNEGDDGFSILGFKNYAHSERPQMLVSYPILGFDGLPHSAEKELRCVYRWNGNEYVNATQELPQDVQTYAHEAQARYLEHWGGNPKADYAGGDGNDDGEDSADRRDAIEYWANAMCLGQADEAKIWLLQHTNPRLGEHLLRIEPQLNKLVPREGARLSLIMGNRESLKPSSIQSASPKILRDPLTETAAPGSGLTDQPLDLDTLQHRVVTDDDFSGRSLASLTLSYNVIYAAHGYVFKRTSLQQVFSQLRGYSPNPAFREADLSDVEKANLKTIRAYERTRFGY